MLTFPPDFSFIVQIASFVILWFGLKRLLFDPVLKVLDERTARTTGARRQAEELNATAQVSAAEYDRRMQDVRAALAAELETARSATQHQERQVLSAAREQASAQLAQLRDTLSRQIDAARPAVATEAHILAAQVLERVVGRPVA